LIITFFRARLRPGAVEEHEYASCAERIAKIARGIPGCISCRHFAAADGERVIIAEFETERALRVWTEHREHVEALRKARTAFCLEYRIQVCSVQRNSVFPSGLTVAMLGG
jgi:heme-degrading monooxygenase HmoA